MRDLSEGESGRRGRCIMLEVENSGSADAVGERQILAMETDLAGLVQTVASCGGGRALDCR